MSPDYRLRPRRAPVKRRKRDSYYSRPVRSSRPGSEVDRRYRSSLKWSDYSDLDREDILQAQYEPEFSEGEYWDYSTIDYGAGEYEPEYDYEEEYPPPPGHVHRPGQRIEHRYAHERWARQRYGVGPGLPEYWTDRDGDYEPTLQAQYPDEMDRYYPEDYYVAAPEYYRERYAPEEDTLQKLYLRMFRNIEYNVKVPVMQLIATGALFFIFIMNYYINYEYVEALGNFSPWVKIQPIAVAAILAAIFGIFIYLFPKLDRDIRRTVTIGTIILLIFFFGGPALVAGLSESSYEAVGQAFAVTIIEFLKLAAILVYWAPMFLGIYGIWSRNSFYVGASAMFLFLIIIILDIYLFYEDVPITKIKDHWPTYVIFSIILFCYIEMSDSAITFANFTSVSDKQEIDPGYYDHLDRIIQKYFVYFILFIIFILILSGLTLNFDGVLRALGSTQAAESLELTSIYGIILSLVVLGIVIIFIGLFIRYEASFKKLVKKISRAPEYFSSYKITPPEPKTTYNEPTSDIQRRNRPTKVRRY